MVRPEGFEPPTFCSEDRRSNPLSYGRIDVVYYSNRVKQMDTALPIYNFKSANKYLRRFHDSSHSEYTLDNMRNIMEFLGNPQDKFKAIHVAGTSGKTSTAYYISSLLTATDKKVGLSVSPHVDELNERVQINSVPLEEKIFCESLSVFLSIMEGCPFKPSWFEVMIAFAYWYFAKVKVDYGVIEVGLGGLKDGSNVINAQDKICVITDIGHDHVNVLGSSLREIAAQKAGIIFPGNTVLCVDQDREALKVVEETALRQNAELHIISPGNTNEPNIPNFQQRNWSLAYEVFKYIQKRDSLIALENEQLEKTRRITVPGRMDIRHEGEKTIVMDGAHNAQKMTAFAESFKKLFPQQKPAVLLAMKQGKEYKDIVPILASISSRMVTTKFSTTQDLPILSTPATELAEAFENYLPVKAIENLEVAYQDLINGPEKICVIVGSLYLLGEVRKLENLI